MRQRLKFACGTARAEVIAAEFFDKFLVSVNDSRPPFDVGFRRISPSTLTALLKTTSYR
jgi:hypothetical protein